MRRVLLGMFLMTPIAAANPPPAISPPPPSKSVFDQVSPGPGVWDRIQGPLDRSNGQIVDQQTYEINSLRNFSHLPEFQRLQLERERSLRIDRPITHVLPPRQLQEELNRREYELFINDGFYISAEAAEDEKALKQAQADRNQQIVNADAEHEAAIKAHPENRAAIDAAYVPKTREIYRQYELKREKILGYAPTTSTSQPSTRP